MAWFEGGGAVFHLVYLVSSCFSVAFSSYSPKSLYFNCYTSLYFLNYDYDCGWMNTNEM
jgi:hypothetical protein